MAGTFITLSYRKFILPECSLILTRMKVAKNPFFFIHSAIFMVNLLILLLDTTRNETCQNTPTFIKIYFESVHFLIYMIFPCLLKKINLFSWPVCKTSLFQDSLHKKQGRCQGKLLEGAKISWGVQQAALPSGGPGGRAPWWGSGVKPSEADAS